MRFHIRGLDPTPFQKLFALTDEALAAAGAVRRTADDSPGYPCRVSLEDASIGEELILLPYEHHPVATPYRGAGPIYVRRSAERAFDEIDVVPAALERRLLSIRAYDDAGLMRGAEVSPGAELRAVIERLFGEPEVAYLHVHLAKPGCFACRVDRADA